MELAAPNEISLSVEVAGSDANLSSNDEDNDFDKVPSENSSPRARKPAPMFNMERGFAKLQAVVSGHPLLDGTRGESELTQHLTEAKQAQITSLLKQRRNVKAFHKQMADVMHSLDQTNGHIDDLKRQVKQIKKEIKELARSSSSSSSSSDRAR